MNQITHAKKTLTTPSLQEIEKLTSICQVLSTSPFYSKMGAGGVLAIWLTATELNLPVMACLNGAMYTFDGKVTLSAQLMNMLIVNAGHQANIVYLDDTGCKIRFVRADRTGPSSIFEYEFNMEHAEKAGYFGVVNIDGNIVEKPKSNWVKHRRDMFFSRCLSGGARKFMPDVLMNCYGMGEIEDFNNETQINILPAQAQHETPQKINVTEEQLLEFKNKFQVGSGNYHDQYLHLMAKTKNKELDYVIKSACAKEDIFLTMFNEWFNSLPATDKVQDPE